MFWNISREVKTGEHHAIDNLIYTLRDKSSALYRKRFIYESKFHLNTDLSRDVDQLEEEVFNLQQQIWALQDEVKEKGYLENYLDNPPDYEPDKDDKE